MVTRLVADDGAQTEAETKDADGPAAPAAAPAAEERAIQLIEEARRRLLYDRTSVQAKLRETVSIGPRKFRGEGTYVAGEFPRLRLELAIDVGGTQGDLLEICDGTILWTVQEIAPPGSEAPEVQVARTVISDVREALEATMDVPETFLIAGLGVGGLPALLAALERSMTFEAIRELEEDGRKYSVIQGRWSDDYLNRLTGGKPDTPLPSYIPDHVRIYFDSEANFPTRILYLRRTEPEAKTFTAILSLEFTDIVLDAPVSEELFQYTPGPTIDVRDRTGEYLKLIDEAARKSRADGSVPITP